MRHTSLRDAIVNLRRKPLLLVVQNVLRHVPFKPVDFARLRFLTFDGVPRVPVALLRGRGAVRCATADDLEDLERLESRVGMFQKRFANGDRCVVAVVDGLIVGYEWFCDRPMHHETAWGLPILIPAGFVYAYDAYIDPAYRNTGVWLRFKAHLGEWMIAIGKHGVLTFVEDGNLPSLRTHLRFGFKPDRTVLAMKILGVKLLRELTEPMPAGEVAYRSNRSVARTLRGSEL